MHLTLIINTVVCLLGGVAGLFFAAGSIISIANMKLPWAAVLLVMALLVPVNFAIAGIGAWIANARGLPAVSLGLIAFPWIFGIVFVALMFFSLSR